MGVHFRGRGVQKTGHRFPHNVQPFGVQALEGFHGMRGADVNRVERHAELVGNHPIGIDLDTFGPLRTGLGPGRELIGAAHFAQAIDQDAADMRVFGMNFGKGRRATVGQLLARRMKERGRDAVRVHAKGFGLRAGIAGKEFIRNPTLGGHGRDLGDLIERVDHAGHFEIAPGMIGAALDGLVKQVQHGVLANQGRGGNCRDSTDQTILGVAQEIFDHGIIAKAVRDAEVDMGVKRPGEQDFALNVDLTLGLTQA